MKPGDIGIMPVKGGVEMGGVEKGGQIRWWEKRALFTWDYPFVLHSHQSWLDLPRLIDAFLGDISTTYSYQSHCQSGASTELSLVKTQGQCLRVTAHQDPKLLPIISLWFQEKLKVIFWFHVWGAKCKFLCTLFKSRRSHNAMDCLSANIY